MTAAGFANQSGYLNARHMDRIRSFVLWMYMIEFHDVLAWCPNLVVTTSPQAEGCVTVHDPMPYYQAGLAFCYYENSAALTHSSGD